MDCLTTRMTLVSFLICNLLIGFCLVGSWVVSRFVDGDDVNDYCLGKRKKLPSLGNIGL